MSLFMFTKCQALATGGIQNQFIFAKIDVRYGVDKMQDQIPVIPVILIPFKIFE
jgi:hypothetical protein